MQPSHQFCYFTGKGIYNYCTLLLLLLAGTNFSEFSDDITIAKNSTRPIVLHGLEIIRENAKISTRQLNIL